MPVLQIGQNMQTLYNIFSLYSKPTFQKQLERVEWFNFGSINFSKALSIISKETKQGVSF